MSHSCRGRTEDFEQTPREVRLPKPEGDAGAPVGDLNGEAMLPSDTIEVIQASVTTVVMMRAPRPSPRSPYGNPVGRRSRVTRRVAKATTK